MKRAILAGFLVLLLCPIASAETYRISGKATYADNTPVSLDSSMLNVRLEHMNAINTEVLKR